MTEQPNIGVVNSYQRSLEPSFRRFATNPDPLQVFKEENVLRWVVQHFPDLEREEGAADASGNDVLRAGREGNKVELQVYAVRGGGRPGAQAITERFKDLRRARDPQSDACE